MVGVNVNACVFHADSMYLKCHVLVPHVTTNN